MKLIRAKKDINKLLYKIEVLGILLGCMMFSTACANSNAAFNGSRVSNDHEFVMAYTVFNTSDHQDFTLESGDAINVAVANSAGNLKIKIQKGQEDPIYEGNDIPTSTFQVIAKESGTYTITVTGEHAKGSVTFEKVNK